MFVLCYQNKIEDHNVYYMYKTMCIDKKRACEIQKNKRNIVLGLT